MEEGDNDENRLPEPDLENAVDVEFRAENHSSEMLSKMNDLRMTHSDTQDGSRVCPTSKNFWQKIWKQLLDLNFP